VPSDGAAPRQLRDLAQYPWLASPRRQVVFRNVRCVPDFHYTLLSVTQLWEEQRIDAQFADSRSLRLPNGLRFPYLAGRRLPSLSMVSRRVRTRIGPFGLRGDACGRCRSRRKRIAKPATPRPALRPLETAHGQRCRTRRHLRGLPRTEHPPQPAGGLRRRIIGAVGKLDHISVQKIHTTHNAISIFCLT
jgi:hypothetical protein